MSQRDLIDAYNAAWNAHDLDAIAALHTAGVVFANHTAGEYAEGDSAVREHIAGILEAWPDLSFEARRVLHGPGHAVCEWTATATHSRPLHRGPFVAAPTGRRLEWRGVDVFSLLGARIARKDVYSDSMAILTELGLLNGTPKA